MMKSLMMVFVSIYVFSASAGVNWLYESRFNGSNSDWRKENGAVWEKDIGRTGGSLKLSTWEKDGRQGIWQSPLFKVEGKTINVGAWSAQCMAYAQEPYYCGILAIVFYDSAQKELSKSKLIDFTMEPRGYFLEGLRMVSEGLSWKYYAGETAVPATASSARLVFAWTTYYESYRKAEEITGAVWVDDITVQSGSLNNASKQVVSTADSYPFELGLRTPVDINLFTDKDPLQFDVLLYREGSGEVPSRKDIEDATLEYNVTDYQRLLLDSGASPFVKKTPPWAPEPLLEYKWEAFHGKGKPMQKYCGLLKTVYLGEKVRASVGQWLALECKLVKNGKVLATGDISFAVLKPDMDYSGEYPEKFHFIRGHSCGKGRNFDVRIGDTWKMETPPDNPWKPGQLYPSWLEKINSKGITWLGWSNWWLYMKQGESPDFNGKLFSENIRRFSPLKREVKFEERIPGYTYCAYLQQKKVPTWAVREKNGKWSVDTEAYSQYLAADARHTAATTFFPGGCEAVDPVQFADVLVAGAKAIKQVDRRLSVGVVSPGFSLDTAQKMPREIIENLDIFVDDIYNERVNALPFKQELARRGFPGKEVWLQEHCEMVARDLIPRSRSMLSYVSFALAHGVDKIFWWSSPAEAVVMNNKSTQWSYGPNLRGGFTMKTDRVFNSGWRTSGLGVWPGNEKYWYPFPELITQYHINNYLGFAYDPEIVKTDKDCEVYLFKNKSVPGFKGQPVSVLTGFLDTGSKSRAYLIKSDIPFSWVDIYGRQKTAYPLDGNIMLSLGEYPVLGNFHGLINRVELKQAPVTISAPLTIAAKETCKMTVLIENPIGKAISGTLSLSVDSNWGVSPAIQEYKLDKGAKTSCEFSLTPPKNVAIAAYPLFLTFKDSSGKVWGALENTVSVGGDITISAGALPAAIKGDADAILVSLANNTGGNVNGKLSFTNPITPELRPEQQIMPCSIPAENTTEVRIDLKSAPERIRGYDFEFTFQPDKGESIIKNEPLFFIGAAHADKPVKVDADPSDWDTENLIPLIFFRDYFPKSKDYVPGVYMEKHGCGWTGKDDAYVKFYMRWDEGHLYWMAVIADDKKTCNNPNLDANNYSWCFDKLSICLYPWAFNKGDSVKGCAYKTEFGLGLEKSPEFVKRQSPVGGLENKNDIQFAAKETARGYIFEGAYSRESLRPLVFKEGSKFRMEMEYHDMDEPVKKYICDGVIWFGGGANVSGDINLFGQLTLVGGEKK
jgi:hypothetical protein